MRGSQVRKLFGGDITGKLLTRGYFGTRGALYKKGDKTQGLQN